MGSVPFGDLEVFEGFSRDVGFSSGSSASSSLVLDGERRELVTLDHVRLERKGGGGPHDARAAMALKSHSEAEKRRRERINFHLAKLRTMVPCNDKLDKAALLDKVISQVKEMKSFAKEISKGCTVPSDMDEVRVEIDGDVKNGSFSIKASLSCEDRPELLSDLKQTIQALHLRTLGAEISTLGGRVKHVLVLAPKGEPDNSERHTLVTSVHQSLNSILERASSTDFLQRTPFSSKRRRMSPFESSCSSS